MPIKRDKGAEQKSGLPFFYLLYSTSFLDKVIGVGVILIGILVYVFFSLKQDIRHLKELFLSEVAIFFRRMARLQRFLGNLLVMLHRQVYLPEAVRNERGVSETARNRMNSIIIARGWHGI
jgi:hypothetical protein